ncbi:MAG: hypothetical protein ACTSPN_10370 [Promethearchaeota archaeon]
MTDLWVENLQQWGYLLSALMIPLAAIILGRKVFKNKRENGRYNPVRLLIFIVFSLFAVLSILEFFVEMNISPVLNQLFGYNIETINLYSILIGTMASLGLTLAFYANRWEAFYYLTIFIFGGMIIFYYLTGFDAWVENYIIMTGVGSLIFMYLTGFRLKDNGALGIAIFFTLSFSTLLVESSMINQIVIITYDIFILIFSLGYFKPFKEVVN